MYSKAIETKSRSDTVEPITKRFSQYIQQGRVSAAIKLLTEESDNGILPLNEETIQLLQDKHPTGQDADNYILLSGEI